ncbi:MAG: NADH-quinone oxidoreductase subunit A [Deltaproteobacteria bacterium]|nr:MAG: NADH-quinone oxidoreductase subunit A [Deltaproteobacteria bacterium]
MTTFTPTLLAAAAPSPDDLTPYVPAAIALLVGGIIAMGLVLLVSKIGERPLSPVKSLPFEAGSVPLQSARRRVHVQFYVVALLFIVFDLETVFLFIWAPIYETRPLYLLGVMSFFLLLLVVGLVYEWKKGALDWAKLREEEAHDGHS